MRNVIVLDVLAGRRRQLRLKLYNAVSDILQFLLQRRQLVLVVPAHVLEAELFELVTPFLGERKALHALAEFYVEVCVLVVQFFAFDNQVFYGADEHFVGAVKVKAVLCLLIGLFAELD